MELVDLSIELCCLLCFKEDDQIKQIITDLHQKCLKMKGLESSRDAYCTECIENKLLMLSNFPLLIRCVANCIHDINICESLRHLWYTCINIWWPWSTVSCNLQELCIFESDKLFLDLPECFMNKISTHGGLVHVILNVTNVTLNGISMLIENSPNLITFHVYLRTKVDWFISFDPKSFKSALEKKYSQRKLFLCGSFHLVKRKLTNREYCDIFIHGKIDVAPLWHDPPGITDLSICLF